MVAVDFRQKIKQSKETLATLFTGALSVMFTQQLTSYLNGKLAEVNVWGVDSQVFALIITGVILICLVWFGIMKQK